MHYWLVIVGELERVSVQDLLEVGFRPISYVFEMDGHIGISIRSALLVENAQGVFQFMFYSGALKTQTCSIII